MTDRLDKLEAELIAMRPRPLSSNVVDGIDSGLAERTPQRWADRLLICSMCGGAIAACVIVTTLLNQPAGLPHSSMTAHPSADAPRFGDYPLAFARADGGTLDRMK